MRAGGLQLFRCYLRTEFSDENIEFWIACEQYKRAALTPGRSARKLAARAQRIYQEFVAVQAPREACDAFRLRFESVLVYCTALVRFKESTEVWSAASTRAQHALGTTEFALLLRMCKRIYGKVIIFEMDIIDDYYPRTLKSRDYCFLYIYGSVYTAYPIAHSRDIKLSYL